MSAGVDGDSPVLLRRLWPRTHGAWALAVLVVLAFFALDVLALAGSELATDLLIFCAGMAVGMAAAYAAALPLRDRFAASVGWRPAGIALGFASVFGIILIGSALADIPGFPTAEGGSVGGFIYGLASGFGACFLGVLGPSRGAVARTGGRGGSPELTLLLGAAGAVAALFTLAFALYVLFEYVVAPPVRFFA